MKKLILASIILVLSLSTNAQRWGREMGLNYMHASPEGGMSRNIINGNGLTMNYGLVSPAQRFSVGLEMSFTQYGRDKSRQTYEFDDGSSADMDIIVTNSFGTLSAYTNFYPAVEGRVSPYFSAKVGYSWFHTNLNIYDPDDRDHCEPVETELLQHDGTWITSAGAGMRIDFATVFGKLNSGKLFLDISAHYRMGGKVKYMSANAPGHHHGSPADGYHVMTDFINTETLVVHKHHVGHLYNNPIQLIDFRAGFYLRLMR